MNLAHKNLNKNIFLLALSSVAASILFSFFSAPLLRAFSVSVKARYFWLTGSGLVLGLLFASLWNSKFTETAIFVGAIWMTLGAYNEFEKRGINWKQSSLFSLASGLLFAVGGYFLFLKNASRDDFLNQIVEPLKLALVKVWPQSQIFDLAHIVPGILIASLFTALALGWALEGKAMRAFSLRAERVVSRLRWLDFRMPDISIWISLFSLLAVLIVENKSIVMLSVNILIALSVAFMFQGFAVVEFSLRLKRSGAVLRTIIYMLIILQLAPFIVLLGFVDYWVDIRRLLRKKKKQII